MYNYNFALVIETYNEQVGIFTEKERAKKKNDEKLNENKDFKSTSHQSK